ncbi:hypothetical protein D0C36_10555 [Mucilaginibacter conchicola]|uniref:Uncharacterized protein n=1 Tax=Mucilaginibacter conchicola TaxID=2303333 RepID=A0A372NRW7_9SPHI|nr:hypothetical protein [Mucilaginibacter conchicola]RFZ91882.1 hypothetical protein D0C36_10555 [Mucilaginibacter conchicola]
MDVTFFFSAKKKVTKEKTRDLVTRYNVFALAMPVLPARYTMSHFFDSVMPVFPLHLLSAQKLRAKAGRTMMALCGRKGIAKSITEAMAREVE